MKKMKVKLVLFDPYNIALQGMSDTIKMIHDFEIVGAYTREEDVLECLKSNTIDIVIADMMLKSSKGLNFIRQVKNTQKDAKIIVLTESEDEVGYSRAIELGVNAFLRKDTSHSELIGDIISVSKGNNIIPEFATKKKTDAVLSEIETQVLQLIVDEHTTDQIAGELYISRRTVESHVTNICRKLGVDTRIGAVRKATQLNIV
jgi:two-component system vancomycin resistance associated response regulator VraR